MKQMRENDENESDENMNACLGNDGQVDTPSSTRSFSFVHYTWRNGKY